MILLPMVVAACTSSDPWAGAPPLPGGAGPVEWFAISVGGDIVGHEERVRSDSAMSRRRTWSLHLAGAPMTLRSATRIEHEHGLVSQYVRWDTEGERAFVGAAWVPDAVSPPHSGLWPVLDPWSLEALARNVSVADGAVSWTGSSGPVRVRFARDGLQTAVQGAVRLDRVPERPVVLSAFDPVAHLWVPTAPQPRARRSLVGSFEVDGAPVRVDAPIWAEVPARAVPPTVVGDPLAALAAEVVGDARDQREAVQRLVRYVATALDGVPTPGSMRAVDALRSGRGDCDEAATAFVELARAAGLAAEPVGGLVYVAGALGPGLVPHAWAQVRIGGVSVAVDPALGQAPADASHLPLGAGAAQAAARLAAGVSVRLVELR